jgi:hypothetical protein
LGVVPKWLSTLRLLLAAGAWSTAMVVVGLLALLEWPSRLGAWGRPGMVFGAVLISGGLYSFAFFAGRVFPLAHRRVTAIYELAPWVGLFALLATLAGGIA